MGWNYYRKERAGKAYWYKQRSVRVPGRRTPKTETVYIGRALSGPIWTKSELSQSLRGALWKRSNELRHANRTPAEKAAWDAWFKSIEAAKVQRELEAKENARQPATEAARDRYMALKAEVEAGQRRSPAERARDDFMALRAQQQAQMRAYNAKIEEGVDKNARAAEQWVREHGSHKSPSPEPSSRQPPEPSAGASPSPSAPEPNAPPASSSEPQGRP